MNRIKVKYSLRARLVMLLFGITKTQYAAFKILKEVKWIKADLTQNDEGIRVDIVY